MTALGFLEVPQGRKGHGGREAALHQMQQRWDRGKGQPDERERLEESDHPSLARFAAASRNTCPNGVSVMTWW